MPEIPASLERRQQWDPKQAWCRGVGSRRAGSGGNGGNARRCPHRPLPDSPPGWLVRLSAPETACGESPAGSWCSSLPPRPPWRPGSGSEGFPFLLSVGWTCERPRPRPRPACCWVPQPEESSRRLGAGRGLGRGHQLLPALFLLPSFLFWKPAAWELAPGQGPMWSPALMPPAITLRFLHWEPPPPLSGGREGIGGWGWVVRDYILPSTNLNRSAGRGFLAFALLQRRLWGFEFPSPWKKSGATSLSTIHSVRLRAKSRGAPGSEWLWFLLFPLLSRNNLAHPQLSVMLDWFCPNQGLKDCKR